MITPQQFNYRLLSKRLKAAAVGLGLVGAAVAIEFYAVRSLQRSLLLLPEMVLLAPLGLFFGVLGTILVLSGLRPLRLTVENDAVTIRSLHTTRIEFRDLLAVNVEPFHVSPHIAFWPRPGTPIRPRFASYPSRASASTGLMLCPLDGWDAPSDHVVAAVHGAAGLLWRLPAPEQLAAVSLTSFRRRRWARVIGGLVPLSLMLSPVGWFSSGAAVLDFSDSVESILSAFSLIVLGIGMIGIAAVTIALLPQRWSVGPAGIEIHAGGRHDHFAWSDFERLGHSASGQPERSLIGWLAPGLSRPRFRLAGFPSWQRRIGAVRLINLYGWDATAGEMLMMVDRFAGGRYHGQHPQSGGGMRPVQRPLRTAG